MSRRGGGSASQGPLVPRFRYCCHALFCARLPFHRASTRVTTSRPHDPDQAVCPGDHQHRRPGRSSGPLGICDPYGIGVEGPVHKELQVVRQLLTEMEPSILALWRPHLVVKGLPATTDPAEISRQLDEVAAHGTRVSRALRVWKDSALRPGIKDAVDLLPSDRRTSTSAWSTTSWLPSCEATRRRQVRRSCSRRRSIRCYGSV